MINKLNDRPSWLAARTHGIGGSDAGAVLGANKYKTNVRLWEEKTGRVVPEDISDKPAVIFGKTAEPLIRDLFKLDHPEFNVDYHEFWIYRNPGAPYIFATLDGELTDKNGLRGILEIKTCTIQNKAQWDEWEDGVPQSYYVQLLHQLIATGWDFAILRAYIRYYKDGVLRVTIREYRIDRIEVEEELKYLTAEEEKFWDCVEKNTRPPLILPEIRR
ncbi:MAG: YqaJ viral recombinase family protein [Ruminococcus sp.]|nr:YqaJ viral recombinase family protein [Ruminococcus sp.]